jgi:prolyl-tRNA editing enzyme YbaK/EbsC (Cys-tRNA(Pro) deacylase)
MNSISKKIVTYLEKSGYKYEIIEHRTTYTAWDTAQTEKIKPQEVVKALVLSADKNIVLALLPANRNLDKKKFLALLNAQRKKAGLKSAKKIEWAKENWIKKNIFGKVGAIAPFREIVKLDIYMDKLLTKNKKIFVGSGEYIFSVKVLTNQYIKKEEPVLGNFSVKKK